MVSPNVTVPERETYIGSGFSPATNRPGPVVVDAGLQSSKSDVSLVGLIGMVVVGAIFALSVYFAVRYLL